MSHGNMEPATGEEMEQPKRRIASNGYILPDPICEGEVLIDIAANQWKLGRSVGIGGFGEVYLASSNAYEPVGSDAQHVVKVEPHKNGPLFVEINCYLRVAKSDMIDEWKKGRKLKHVGLSRYIGSGSHVYRGQKYRFLVLERYGQDLDKLYMQNGRFPVKTVCYLGIQILDTLEYIHSRGYIHADIKGPNLLLGYHKGTENYVYLLDFGVASRYLDGNGVHKEYVYDQRKAHAGTLKYVSRDAHIGAFSRRGDLETLSYNMIQWLGGKMPWEDKENPEYIQSEKNSFMSNIPLLMRQCFPNSQPPAVLTRFLKYVASLNFETKPSYAYCRNLLKQGVEDSGYMDDGKLVFGGSPLAGIIANNNQGNKCRATELKPKKIVHNTLRQPCVSNRMIQNSPSSVLQSYKQFNGKKIISGNLEEQVQKHARLDHNLFTVMLSKYEPMVLTQRLSNEVIQKSTSLFSNHVGHKRRATEDPENTAELKRKKRVHNTLQQCCASNRTIRNSPSSVLQTYRRFNGKKIVLGNPKKQVKKHATLNCNLPSTIPTKYEPVVLIEHLPNEVIQKFTASLPEVSERTKHWQQTADTSSLFSNPTPAMLEIMLKMREKKSSSTVKVLNSAFMRATVSKSNSL
jgi:vaccinia related kinase